MAVADADRNLLFGILALHNGFISRDGLVRAMSAWVGDKAAPLGEILVRLGDLSREHHSLMEALVKAHLQQHGGDVQDSLAAMSTTALARILLQELDGSAVSMGLTGPALGPAAETARTPGPEADGAAAALVGRRFRILRLHDEGGLGAVYLARDEELNREVALKQIKERFGPSPDSRQRFVAEAEITGNLEHPGIVPVYSLGRDELGRPYYAMRFIKGESLKSAIERFHASESPERDPGERSLELRKLLGHFVSVCQAVAYAHSRGVIHRDLKPANVMLGKFGETLVVDWGLAKALGRDEAASMIDPAELTVRPSSGSDGAMTAPGAPMGTPAYMSPEQASGEMGRVGPSSDVHSLGATLYHLLTGRAPVGGGAREAREQVRRGAIVPPRSVKPDVPRALEAVCLKAMALRPEDRYASPLALAEEVEHWLADEPVSAHREGRRERLARWSRRHRAWIRAGAAALVVVLGVTAAFAAQQARSAERERTARTLAQTRLGEIEKANELLSSIFTDLDPQREEKEGKSLRAILGEHLDQVASGLNRQAIGDPLTLAHLQDTLGTTQLHLGYPKRAIDLLDQAAHSKEAILGPDHPDTLTSRGNLAAAYLDAGRAAEAIELNETTLKPLESKLGPDHPDTLAARANLAAAYLDVGRAAEAIKVLETTLKLMGPKLGPDHPRTLMARGNLAKAYRRAGRTADAIELYENTLTLFESKLGPDHPHALTTRINLGNAYLDVGRAAEAIAMYERALKILGPKLGPDHHDTLASRNNLAMAYLRSGRAAEAVPLLETTLKILGPKLGPDHPDTLTARSNLAWAYSAAGRAVEALALDEATLKLRESKLGPDHPDTLAARNNLAEDYWDVGCVAESIAMHESTLKLRESKLGPDHPGTLQSRGNLASAYESIGRWSDAEPLVRDSLGRARSAARPNDPALANVLARLGANLLKQAKSSEAEPVLRECLTIREKAMPDLWSRYHVMGLLGEAMLDQGRPAESEPLIVQGHEGMKAREGSIPAPARARLSEAAARVVRLYERWGKPDRAAEWKARLGLADLPDNVFEPP